MIFALARKFFGSANERKIKSLSSKVQQINELESQMQNLTDEQLKAKTQEFRGRLTNGATHDDILPEAYAVVREAAKRTLGQRHFDVQLMGGMILHEGAITEMRTGEGKTLVGTLPVYLNALTGKGVHVVTVNDYLAQRDSAWMGQIYEFLGLSVGCIHHDLNDDQRRAAYLADITYATNNELGFDYLRDNMKFSLAEMVQRPFNFAIVDEVDSILIDEARTPLIISGPSQDSSELYIKVNKVIPYLSEKEGDFEKDEKAKSVTLTDSGTERVEQKLKDIGLLEEGTLYDLHNVALVHHINQALRAHHMYAKDRDYILKDQKVIIIDEFTGRMMEGRRYSEGLHQALEAKENMPIQRENQTLASITFQNYFKLYPKLAGMTGTGMTEVAEFGEIYNLEVVEVPTNVPVQRIDEEDCIYRTAAEKYEAIVKDVQECIKKGQPVLVGTVSIENSERLSTLLKKYKVPHNVLNARFHEKEAEIVAQAGRPGAVTIATNMAGRGTDIQLGGNLEMILKTEFVHITDEKDIEKKRKELAAQIEQDKKKVLEAGGLYIIGTERHESRRIDNQLRGRSGRQGDPGCSKFYLSLEDDLMRIFGSQRIEGVLQKLGLEEGEAIVHPWISKALQKAQEKVEAHHFDIRKNLLKFDNVMNDQRKVVYEQRRDIMASESISDVIEDMRLDVLEHMVEKAIPEKAYIEAWDVKALKENVKHIFNLDVAIEDWVKEEGIANEEIFERLNKLTTEIIQGKIERYGATLWQAAEKSLLLQILDQLWKEHLLSLDHLRQGIGLRAYAQKDPLNEYKQEAFTLFEEMLDRLRSEVVRFLMHLEIQKPEQVQDLMPQTKRQKMHETRQDPALVGASGESGASGPIVRPSTGPIRQEEMNEQGWKKTPRNAECPCGSGKKYKYCHGAF